MGVDYLIQVAASLPGGSIWSPLTFAVLVGLASVLVWVAVAPASPLKTVQTRLDGYLDRPDAMQQADMDKPFVTRAVMPSLRRILGALGRLAPKRNVEATRLRLLQAGEPGGLSVLDFFGLPLLLSGLLGVFSLLLLSRALPLAAALRGALAAGAVGFFSPFLWLRSRVKRRKHEILRALPDALDMLTIGVEAGLAFESALLKVGERWDNALSREFQRCVAEMRVGTSRDEALRRMVERTGVEDIETFVAVLIQSGRLGVSIGEVLHSQAAQMRTIRRQRAEELARQAAVKMVFPLVFLILPAMFVVILGPALPILVSTFTGLSR